MKKILLTTIFISLFFVLFVNKVIACVALHGPCDATNTCCGFPSYQCQGGYCVAVTNPSCGVDTRQCCQSPNPACGSGLTCSGGYCRPTALIPTATPIPTCGQHNQICCAAPNQCLSPNEQCIGGVCMPGLSTFPCGNHFGPCCVAPTPPCVLSTDICGSGSTCQPKPTPIIPSSPSGGVINFSTLSNAIPGLKIFLQPIGPANVATLINEVVKFIFVFAGLLLLFYLIYGGFQMIIATGEEKKLVEAKTKITNALIGFILIFVSYWLVQIIEVIFGIQIF